MYVVGQKYRRFHTLISKLNTYDRLVQLLDVGHDCVVRFGRLEVSELGWD
jgi:hypothetical protein